MALKATYEIRCSCNTTFTGDVFEYVFSEHDPELKDSILSGDFNLVTCPSCDRRIPVENRFLYRDEKNKLWVWVCKREEEPQRDAPAEELIEKNASMEFHFLEDRESYRKFLVFGRGGLLELLLKEDPALKRKEGRKLKTNPAHRLILEGNEEPGYLFLRGEKIRISLPLRFSEAHQKRVNGPEGKKRWLQYYAQGLNVHNPYSSFLDRRLQLKWNRIREKELLGDAGNEFDDFAESWAGYRIDRKQIKARYPERRGFFEELRKRNISRRVRSFDARLIPRESA
ncbi:MAG: hypothetical protein JJE32_03320 [Deltaproteobacteria bacterium]|nr:hypothetical protein [Deltaproteobacteria bacterium]